MSRDDKGFAPHRFRFEIDDEGDHKDEHGSDGSDDSDGNHHGSGHHHSANET